MNSAKEQNISTITKLSELLIETKLKSFWQQLLYNAPLFAQHKILKINQMLPYYLHKTILYFKYSIVKYGLLFKLIVIDKQSYIL